MLAARRALQEANKALVDAELEMVNEEDELDKVDSEIVRLDEQVANALRREMMVLGVLQPLPDDQEIALGHTDFSFLDSAAPIPGVD